VKKLWDYFLRGSFGTLVLVSTGSMVGFTGQPAYG